MFKHIIGLFTATIALSKIVQLNTTLYKFFVLLILFGSTLIVNPTAYAAERIFQLSLSSQRVSEDGIEVGKVAFPTTSVSALTTGEQFEVMLPTGAVVNATVIDNSGSRPVSNARSAFIQVSNDAKVLQLSDGGGSLELHLIGNTITGLTLHDIQNKKFYRSALDGNGTGTLLEVDADTILCGLMPKDETVIVAQSPNVANIPSELTLATVQNLESRPGATHTIFINNWGGVLSNTAWNINYSNGEDINFTPYSSDNDTTAFSTTDINNMWLAWSEMAEDYADFDVNITTKQSVYNAAPIVDRSQIIASTTCAWFGCGFGGVAYVTVFNNTTDYYKTGWTWNASSASAGMTHSHEAGHQMGLTHDGTSAITYYRGHGQWGPVMGAPFGKRYVQWSIGDYPDANNTQDDLAILTNVLGVQPDDVGDSISSPTELLGTSGDNFTITQGGIGSDVDMFEFTLSSPQQISIELLPLLGYWDESQGSNVALSSVLQDSGGTVLANMSSSDNLPLTPDTNAFTVSTTLPADTYYLGVRGESPDTNWATGFDEYGNGGEYRLVFDVNPEINNPVPNSTLSGTSQTFNWIDHGNDIVDYWVNIGSAVNGGNYLRGRLLGPDASSVMATALPDDGSTVFVRFWWQLASGAWEYTDYTYTAFTSSASDPMFSSPAPGSTLAGTSDTFTWSANGANVTEWWLYLGNSVGEKQIANSGSLSTTASFTASSLPTNSSTVFARLWYKTTSMSGWQYIDDSFVASETGGPSIISPVEGSTVSGTPVSLEWDAGTAAVTEWWIYVGTTSGARDFYDSGSLETALTGSVPMPADGTTAYIRLWYKVAGVWGSTVTSYISAP